MRTMVETDRNACALAALRISLGLLFLIFAQYKCFSIQFTLGGGFQFWINRFVTDGAYPFMLPILQKFVLPQATPIAFLVAYGELAIGLALLTGILVRPASICGLIYMFTLLFSANYPGPHAAFWQYFGAWARASRTRALLRCICARRFRSTLVVAPQSPQASRHSQHARLSKNVTAFVCTVTASQRCRIAVTRKVYADPSAQSSSNW